MSKQTVGCINILTESTNSSSVSTCSLRCSIYRRGYKSVISLLAAIYSSMLVTRSVILRSHEKSLPPLRYMYTSWILFRSSIIESYIPFKGCIMEHCMIIPASTFIMFLVVFLLNTITTHFPPDKSESSSSFHETERKVIYFSHTQATHDTHQLTPVGTTCATLHLSFAILQ